MKAMKSRLEALESVNLPPGGVERWHSVVQGIGQTRDEALDEYGREKIGENDGVIINRIVAPVTDADGNLILMPRPTAPLQ